MTDIQNIQSQPRDIMHYESDIWAIADLLLAASVKQSDFPAYMMPFFALMMLEGRMPASSATENTWTLLDKFGMVEGDKLKNASAALFVKRPTAYPQFLLRMARFRGVEKNAFIDNMRVKGNFFELLDAGMSFFFKHLSQSGVVVGLRREEQLEIPVEALREALTNALCHRLLDSPSGSVGISILDDRVEIENTGHLPNELTTETIKLPHRSYPQNPIIADALFMTAFLESWGTGVNRMVEVEACKTVRLPEPEYGTDGSFVWITFKRPNASANLDTNLDTKIHLSDKQKEVLAFCIIPRSSREILMHIGETNHTRNRDRFVNYLVDEGYLERTIPDSPNSPQQKYVVKSK